MIMWCATNRIEYNLVSFIVCVTYHSDVRVVSQACLAQEREILQSGRLRRRRRRKGRETSERVVRPPLPRDAKLNLRIAPSSGGCTCWLILTSPWLLTLLHSWDLENSTRGILDMRLVSSISMQCTIGRCVSGLRCVLKRCDCVWAVHSGACVAGSEIARRASSMRMRVLARIGARA